MDAGLFFCNFNIEERYIHSIRCKTSSARKSGLTLLHHRVGVNVGPTFHVEILSYGCK